MALVSIVLPTFNMAPTLSRAIESVLRQDLEDWELIIINDGSTDHTPEIVESFANKDQRIKVINQKTTGLAHTLNKGLNSSSSELIARIDADDYWSKSNKLSKQVEFLDRNPEVGLIGTWAEAVSLSGQHMYNLKYPTSDDQIRKKMLLANCFIHSSVMFRKKIALEAGAYDPEKRVEDYDLWFKLGNRTQLANIPEIMVSHTINPQGYTQAKNKLQIKSVMDLIREHRKSYPGYFSALIKWRLQYFIVSFFGAGFWIKLKAAFRYNAR